MSPFQFAMKKIIIALVLWSAMLLSLLAACGQETPTAMPSPTPTAPNPTTTSTSAAAAPATLTPAPQASGICAQGTKPAFIQDVVLAQDTQGNNFTPVNATHSFAPDQPTFHAIVTLKEAPPNLTLTAKWYLLQAVGFQPNTKLNESEFTIKNSSGNNDLALKRQENLKVWPPGSYCVEIYADKNLAISQPFQVVNHALAPAGINPIKQVVLAEGINPTTYEPVNPTTTFKSNAPLIYTAVRIEDSPPGTIYKVKWYPPGVPPLEQPLQPGPKTWFESHLIPLSGSFPTGKYQVEIYVNDQLVDTETFTVE